MNPKQLKDEIITPVLNKAGLGGDDADMIVLCTAAHESLLGKYIVQENGPAVGIFQMEPKTHHNLMLWLLENHLDLNEKINQLVTPANLYTNRLDELKFNLAYATIMCRLRYMAWNPEPLPKANDINAIAQYWKTHYNTDEGGGTAEEFINHYNQLVKPYL